MPLYPLYALLFADAGCSDAEISALFIIWSATGILAEVPTGAWADAHSRRTALVLAGLCQAAGHLLWIALPGFPGFAAGFVLWGVGGSLASGSFQALVHDGLSSTGDAHRYPAVIGRAEAAAIAVQVPLAVVAGLLFAAGGYVLAGLVSIAVCLLAAAVAATLPDIRDPGDGEHAASGSDPSCAAGLRVAARAGLREAIHVPAVRVAVAAAALLNGFDALEEYFPLLAVDWGVAAAAVPIALLPMSLLAALAAASAGAAAGLRAASLRIALVAAASAFAVAVLLAVPAGLAGVAVFYATFRLAAVLADARLQAAISGPARATVTSAAGVATDLAGIGLYLLWALGGPGLVTVVAILVTLALPIPGRPWEPRSRSMFECPSPKGTSAPTCGDSPS